MTKKKTAKLAATYHKLYDEQVLDLKGACFMRP